MQQLDGLSNQPEVHIGYMVDIPIFSQQEAVCGAGFGAISLTLVEQPLGF